MIRWGAFTPEEKQLAAAVVQHLGCSDRWRLLWPVIPETRREDHRFGALGYCSSETLTVAVDDSGMVPTESIFGVLLHEIGHARDAFLAAALPDEPATKRGYFHFENSPLPVALEQREKNLADHHDPLDVETQTLDRVLQLIDQHGDDTSEKRADNWQLIWRWYSWQMAGRDNPSIAERLAALMTYPLPEMGQNE